MRITVTHSDVRPHLDDLEDMKTPFDFLRGALGRRAAAETARGILSFMEAELGPDGFRWPELSRTYAEWKATVAPGAPMAVLYGHMRTQEQLTGEQEIAPRSMAQTYGIDDEAREEAMKFQEGGIVTGTNQPPRRFYDFNAEAERFLADLFDAEWKLGERLRPDAGLVS